MFNPRLGREELSKLAQVHYMNMKFKYEQQTISSFNRAVVRDASFQHDKNMFTPAYNQQILIEPIDTVSAIYSYRPISTKLAALNFASFKHPGGKFLSGSNAQEEALCHASNLYNILLPATNEYYNVNKKMLNRSLYQDKSIYIPDVVFDDGHDNVVTCDIITCAAPNKRSAQKYHNVSDADVNTALISRIDHVLYMAYVEKVDTLILGAFGCGVFGNDPYEVATIFKELLKLKYHNCFDKVIFAIPGGKNFEAFVEVFNN